MSFASNRRFRLWDFNVSHKQMLVRSPASPSAADNLDLVFVGVEYVQLPTTLVGVELTQPTEDEVISLRGLLGAGVGPLDIYCLASGGMRGFVVAAAYMVWRNKLDIFESSLEYFAATQPGRDLGEVLDSSSGSQKGGLTKKDTGQ